MKQLDRDLRFLAVATFLWGFGATLFFYIQPLYISFLGASPAQIGFTLGIAGLVGLLMHVPMAQLADRIGRKRVMVAGWSLGCLSTFVMALAPDWCWFIPALAAYQLSNFAMSAFFGYVAAHVGQENPNRSFATISSTASVGTIISPSIGGWIGEQYGLRALYFIAALLFALSTLALVSIREQKATVQIERPTPRRLLGDRSFMWQIVFAFFLFFAIDLGQVMIPKYLQDVGGLTLGQIGRLGTLGSLGVVVLTLVLGRFPSERRRALFATQLLALTALILWSIGAAPVLIALAYLVHGRNRLAQPFIDGRLAYTLKAEWLNLGYSFREIAMRLGLSVSPYLAGILYTQNPTWPLYGGMIGLVITLSLTFTLPANLRLYRIRSLDSST